MKRLWLLVSLVIALGSVPAQGVELMVNGSVPSRHWQAYVDSLPMPTPNVVVPLYLRDCPGLYLRGCFMPDNSLAIYAGPANHDLISNNLPHELGHLFDFEEMHDADRVYFERLWGLRQDWYAIGNEAVDNKGDGVAYWQIPQERFAETYRYCDIAPRSWRINVLSTDTEFLHGYGLVKAAHRIDRTCTLIKQVAAGWHRGGAS